MKLIPDWRQAWRLWSVRASALGALVTAAAAASPDTMLTVWQSLPDEVRGLIPEQVGNWIAAGLFAASMAARVLKQQGAADDR